ncbi:MAG: helix-turn-helix domain-containing protein [Dehalococcoidales bacterium]|nr:helix-turn-helix domain-containing protein [Dehalococcoidales bacterium]
MRNQGMNIAEAAKTLGVSTRTIRRYIKSGKIQAELIVGHFGEEYRILDLPTDLQPEDEDTQENEEKQATTTQSPIQNPGQTFALSIDFFKEMQDKNITMAAQLGIATERIRNLESQLKQLKLLTAPKVSWWKKTFITRKKKS